MTIDTRPKILLVDDVDFFIELEMDYLKRTPAQILVAKNGAQALDIVRRERPSLVFMDVNMPVMDGLTCCRTIKNDPALKSTPIIMVFATSKEVDNQACSNAGADGVLNKPVDRNAFLELGRKFLFSVDRREKRIPCQTSVTVKVNDETFQGMILDISSGGIYIQYRQQIAVEARVQVTFYLPTISPEAVICRGRVAWVNQGFPRKDLSIPQGFGVQFQNLPSEGLNTIRRYLELNAPK